MKLLDRWVPFAIALLYATGSTLSLLSGNVAAPDWFWFLGGIAFTGFSLFRAVRATVEEEREKHDEGQDGSAGRLG